MVWYVRVEQLFFLAAVAEQKKAASDHRSRRTKRIPASRAVNGLSANSRLLLHHVISLPKILHIN